MDGSANINPSISLNKSSLRRNILIVSVLLLIFVTGIVLFLLAQNKETKEPTVSLTKEYDNPFDKNTQYVNPFSEYKNPFDELIK